ncbi:MAG: acyl-CoA desaturase [Chitinophagales bacterium]|nr:acyl-CoA desaturase [Chitinophagales bacterium]
MVTKTILILLMYLVPTAVMISGIFNANAIAFLSMWVLMGIGMVGVGCSIMHDSNHGSYSKNKTLNKILGKVIVLVGGYHVTWKIQHNILHHTYTNIEGLDHDIDAGIFLRFSPNSKWYAMHKFQHLYAWFLYGLLTLQWATIKDFRQVYEYHKLDLLKKEKKTLKSALLEVAVYKILYYALIVFVPIFVMGAPWHLVLIGFVLMHFVAGLSLSAIFQLAHVMEECDFPNPDDHRKMQNNWAVHQLHTTANFSAKSRIMSWFIGGLNRQIEHHLFPHICHIHYKKIAPIVKQTALEYNLPYYEQKTFVTALMDHTRMLRKMGKNKAA